MKKLVAAATNRDYDMFVKPNQKSTTLMFSAAAYLLAKQYLETMLKDDIESGYIRIRESKDGSGKNVDSCMHYEKNGVKYVMNLYNTTCKMVINGPHYQEFEKYIEKFQRMLANHALMIESKNTEIKNHLHKFQQLYQSG